MTARLFTAWALALSLPVAASGQSTILNAKVEERPAGDFGRTFQQLASQPGPFWIAYAVSAQSPDWNSCCWDNWGGSNACCGRCSLEPRKDGGSRSVANTAARGPVELEGSASAIVFYRVEGGQIQKVRAFSDSCQVDAGGRTVYWLTSVPPAASVRLLKGLVEKAGDEQDGGRQIVGEGLLAISAHQAAEGVTALIDLARDASASRVRSEALFWLAQRAGAKAAGTITEAIANDPETKVKERAVFALSQLPADEGVPRLIEVARTNRNPRVRQQAVFWLGQSKDPRALKFFEEILSK